MSAPDMKSASETHVTSKVIIAWAGTMLGAVTLQQCVLGATLVYTLLQIVIAVRRIISGRRETP